MTGSPDKDGFGEPYPREYVTSVKMCKQYRQKYPDKPSIDTMLSFVPESPVYDDGSSSPDYAAAWLDFLQDSWEFQLRALRYAGYTDLQLAVGLGIKIHRQGNLILIDTYDSTGASATFRPRSKTRTEDEILKKCFQYEKLPFVAAMGTEQEARANQIRLDVESQLTEIYRTYEKEKEEEREKEKWKRSEAELDDDGDGSERRHHHIYKYSGRGNLHESVVIGGKAEFIGVAGDEIKLLHSIKEATRILEPLDDVSNAAEPYAFENLDELKSYIRRAKNTSLDHIWHYVHWFVDNFFVGGEHDRNIITIAIILSYFLDKLPSTFYLFPYGKPGSGKGVVEKLFQFLGYRVVMMVSARASSIYDTLGTIEKGQCSIVIDEANRLDENPDIMDILKSGHKSGGRVPRILDASSSKRVREFFHTFCVKVIGAERMMVEWKAEGLLTRIFPIPCLAGHPKFNIDKVEETGGDPVYERLKLAFADLRKLLFAYRLVHYADPLPDLTLNLTGREEELCAPSIRLFYNSNVLDTVKSTLFHFILKHRERKADSFEYEVFSIIKEVVDASTQTVDQYQSEQKCVEITTASIWENLRFKLNGTDIIDQKTGKVKTSSFMTQAFGEVTKHRIADLITVRLGAEKARIGSSRDRGYAFDRERLERAGKIYEELKGIEILPNISKDSWDALDAFPGDKSIFSGISKDEVRRDNGQENTKSEQNIVNTTENRDQLNIENSQLYPKTSSEPSYLSLDLLGNKVLEEERKANWTVSSDAAEWLKDHNQGGPCRPTGERQQQTATAMSPLEAWHAAMDAAGRELVPFTCPCPYCDYTSTAMAPDPAIYGVWMHGFREHEGNPVKDDLNKMGYTYTPESTTYGEPDKRDPPPGSGLGCSDPGCRSSVFDAPGLLEHVKTAHPEMDLDLLKWWLVDFLGRRLP